MAFIVDAQHHRFIYAQREHNFVQVFGTTLTHHAAQIACDYVKL